MKKYFVLLTLIALFTLLIPYTANAGSLAASPVDDLRTFFIKESITVTELADELAESDYKKLMNLSPKIITEITKIGNHEFSTPDAAIIIEPHDEVFEVIFAAIGPYDLSGFPKDMLKASLPNLLSNVLASRNGVESITISSMINLMQTYNRPEEMQDSVLAILVYDWGEDSYCSCVSFTINNVDFVNVSPKIIKCDEKLIESIGSKSLLNEWLFAENYNHYLEGIYEIFVSIDFVSSTEIAEHMN